MPSAHQSQKFGFLSYLHNASLSVAIPRGETKKSHSDRLDKLGGGCRARICFHQEYGFLLNQEYGVQPDIPELIQQCGNSGSCNKNHCPDDDKTEWRHRIAQHKMFQHVDAEVLVNQFFALQEGVHESLSLQHKKCSQLCLCSRWLLRHYFRGR